MTRNGYRAHVLAIPYPAQGHINPLLQFSKRLASSKGLKVTLANTIFIANSLNLPKSAGSVQLETISDGYDDGGFPLAESIAAYLSRLQDVGYQSVAEIITRHKATPNPIECIIYDPFLPWALDVAKQYGLVAAAFFSQSCTVNYTYYLEHHHGIIWSPASVPNNLPLGLHILEPQDMPSFFSVPGSYPAYSELVLNQFSHIEKADFIFANTFYKLEEEVVDSMSQVCPMLTIGPTIPSAYLDNSIEDDKGYGFSLFEIDSFCTDWLNTKPPGSVVYVAFGSMASLSDKQMKELALGLKATNFHFLWVVRASEEEKLPDKLKEETAEKGLLVNWSPQLEVLSHKAIGCFFTHGGWNSTIEALSSGVPMVVMPQWTDQPTNSKLIESLWKVGVRVKVDETSGLVGREEVEQCVREVMGEMGIAMKRNAKKWRELAIEAVSEGGTSDKNIDEFVSKLTSV
ncbi:UDP-glycosyltransferase 74F2-like [Argentina anserina]|uniref:UDP-glycosyltransferase 74F2-like n=1 Tax=Argentina anserina TaxID=57926 RepID=UPI0021764193|nr:UDP-glycosyltransferase 74F2-like [Potentilla anserina]